MQLEVGAALIVANSYRNPLFEIEWIVRFPILRIEDIIEAAVNYFQR